jgi:hypothetical protein
VVTSGRPGPSSEGTGTMSPRAEVVLTVVRIRLWRGGVSDRRFCRRSMLPFRGVGGKSAHLRWQRVSRVVAVGAARLRLRSQSQIVVAAAVVVAFAAGVSPLVIGEDLRRVPVVRFP